MPPNPSKMNRLFFGCAALLWLQAGCSSPRAGSRVPESGTGVPSAVVEKTGGTPVPPLLDPPEPIYRNPKIGVVYLRAHQDEEGRLLGPQIMYQVTDAGGWNVDAAEEGRGYIPAANLETPAGGAPPPAHSPLLDATRAADTIITGLMDPGDKARAEAMAEKAGAGRTTVFDDQAGWLLLPKDEK